MKCLEFKRLALAEPNSDDAAYLAHRSRCHDCQDYRKSVLKMDAELADCLNVELPSDLVAKLQLNQELDGASDTSSKSGTRKRYAIAASFAAALIVGGFILSSQVALNTQIDKDYQSLLAGVVEHMNDRPVTPVWDVSRANSTVGKLLASYDPELKFKNMENLQFGRICPMGEYRGLHATLETESGQITFAYIKDKMVGDIFDASYAGYITRVKPIRGGTLLIFSRNQKALNQADSDLESAMYWDI